MRATLSPPERAPADRVIAVVLDRAHARFFQVTATETVELPSLHSPAMRGGKFHSDRQGGPGWGEHAFHGRIREEERRHYAGIVERLTELHGARSLAGVVLAGPGNTARALREFLPSALADHVIGSARLNPTEVTPAKVRDVALALSRKHQRDAEQALVSGVLHGLGSGRAENGTRAVLAALAKRQVRTLLVRPDVRGTGFRCAGSGRLVLSASDCRGEGEPVPVPDLVGEAIADARGQDAAIVVVAEPDNAKVIDGLAALLRFRQE